jgi:hypothetical protein
MPDEGEHLEHAPYRAPEREAIAGVLYGFEVVGADSLAAAHVRRRARRGEQATDGHGRR